MLIVVVSVLVFALENPSFLFGGLKGAALGLSLVFFGMLELLLDGWTTDWIRCRKLAALLR